MKTRRFASVFLLLVLLCSTLLTPAALADETAVKTPEDPAIEAKAALLVDEKTGTVLYAKNEHDQLYPASLTKIMTCLLVLQAVDSGTLALDQEITAPAEAFRNLDADGSSAGIQVGEILTVEQLLYCLMVVSANESANILAVTVGGSVDEFVKMMNAEAEKLGCKDTHFSNAIGLQDSRHYTSAWDLYLIVKEALKYDEFMAVCDTADIVIPATNLSAERHLYTTNYLLSNWRAIGYRYSSAHGIKTGSTSDAGHCLVSSADKNGLSLLSVVLGAERIVGSNGVANVKSFSETKRLFEWGFSNFSYQTVLTTNDMLGSIPVTLSKEQSSVLIHPAGDVEALLPNTLTPEDLTKTLHFARKTVEAPIREGEELATVDLSYQGVTYASTSLVALNDVSASRSLVLMSAIRDFFGRTIVRIGCVVVILLILALIVWRITVGRRRYRSGKSVRPPRGYRGKRRF